MNFSAPSRHWPETLFDNVLILHMSDLICYILDPSAWDEALGFYIATDGAPGCGFSVRTSGVTKSTV